MQYLPAVALAYALGASARPNPQWPSFSFATPPSQPSGAAPPRSAAPFPIPSGASSQVFSRAPLGTGSACSLATVSSAALSDSAVPSAPAASSVGPVSESAVAAPSGSVSSPADSSSPSDPGSSSPSSITASISIPSGSLSSGGGLPASSGSSALSAAQTIAAGESFDCGMYVYDRGVSCTGQEEGGDSDAVFILESGASLSNCIIGPDQIEGVHCQGGCSLTNVWWSAVCEDAFTIKEQDAGETTMITGGGAFGAEDKVLQHNGGGTLSVSGFTVDGFGKVYRSCGNCDDMYERHVTMDDITATSGSQIAGINSNYGDTAILSNIKVSDVDDICVTYTGNDSGDEPEENGSGPSDYCIYSESDITEI